MDGTAKGGVVLTLAEEMKLPVKFIGMGEKISDLMPFDPRDFADALFRSEEEIAEVQATAPVPEPEPEPAAPLPPDIPGPEAMHLPPAEEPKQEEPAPEVKGWRRFFRR
jgi:hypothetical protein